MHHPIKPGFSFWMVPERRFALGNVRLVRYADNMVLLARTEQQASDSWEQLQAQFAAFRLVVNQEKSRLTTSKRVS